MKEDSLGNYEKDPIGNPLPNVIIPNAKDIEPNSYLVESYLTEANLKPLAEIWRSDYQREQPVQVTFQQLLNYYDRTPQIQVAVSSYAELITGTEMVMNTENEDAQVFLKEWCRKSNFYDKFESLVITWLICGNAILEKLE